MHKLFSFLYLEVFRGRRERGAGGVSDRWRGCKCVHNKAHCGVQTGVQLQNFGRDSGSARSDCSADDVWSLHIPAPVWLTLRGIILKLLRESAQQYPVDIDTGCYHGNKTLQGSKVNCTFCSVCNWFVCHKVETMGPQLGVCVCVGGDIWPWTYKWWCQRLLLVCTWWQQARTAGSFPLFQSLRWTRFLLQTGKWSRSH